ncbi:HdeD family acid-resistance protein [Labrys monachus]|uniref:Uncharacterized membrane protein HdeD (DUF308 family) n=1 Tax=Labrys monachus TaxID=217067 RepID=A0ABU0F8X9_9HYPH|nr:DUF308 domain-containing protein [Labrys monachus]MDQ0391057.1 uncharacterized membrane protein HdeD (DUF308 family) [Labrys monachus]
MASQPAAGDRRSSGEQRSAADLRSVFLAEGVVLVVLGCAAVLAPMLGGLVTVAFLGWLFLIAGIAGGIAAFPARGAIKLAWSLTSAALALLVGLALLVDPFQGTVSLTILLAAFFVVDAILLIGLAAVCRRDLPGRWEWMTMNGVADLIFAGIVLAGLPGSPLWALGLLVGIDMVFGGIALIALAADPRRQGAG